MPDIPSKKGLILSTQEIDRFDYIDIGCLLAEFLKTEDLDTVSLPMKAFDAVKCFLSENARKNSVGMPYIAIKNFNILFEPSLKLNLRNIIEDYAKRMIVVLKVNQDIDSNMMYYPFPGHTEYHLDLRNISILNQTI